MNLANLRRDLEEREVKLQRRVSRIERDLRKPHDPDSQERAVERLNEPVLEALDERVLEELEDLRAAMARIDAGEFGRCVSCAQAIEEARLVAVPTARVCLKCAA